MGLHGEFLKPLMRTYILILSILHRELVISLSTCGGIFISLFIGKYLLSFI